MLDLIQSVDTQVILFFQEHIRNGLLNPVMVFITTLGTGGAIWLALSLVLILTKKYRLAGAVLVTVVAVCFVANDLIIKNIVQRPRPFETLRELLPLVKRPASFSFPSGHTCTSFAAAAAIIKCFGKRGAWAFFVAFLISVSRIYVGVHYPSDVLVGAVLGVLGGFFVSGAAMRFWER